MQLSRDSLKRAKQEMYRDPIETSMVSNLKIALVSPNKGTMNHVRSLLSDDTCPGLIMVPGGVEQAARVAEQERPDALIVEVTNHDETDPPCSNRLPRAIPGWA